MGVLRFLVHDRSRIASQNLEQVYFYGYYGFEELPHQARVFWSESHLVIERDESDSGAIHVPWVLPNQEVMLLGSATLIEREQPYLLEVELARGTLNRLRNQIAEWESLGVQFDDSAKKLVAEAVHCFAHAATCQADLAESAKFASESLELALVASEVFESAYTSQAIAIRLKQTKRLPTVLGIVCDNEPVTKAQTEALRGAFNWAFASLAWKSVEATEGSRNWEAVDAQIRWAQEAGLRIGSGPLLEFDAQRVPDWTYLWEGDAESVQSFMLDHVREVVTRYHQKIQLWEIASRVNVGRALGLSDEERMQTVAQSIETLREIDAKTPVIVAFSQPWSEHVAQNSMVPSALRFADALVRANIGMSGISLELNIGYQPNGSFVRSTLALGRLIDQWSQFELPLVISLCMPSSFEPDANANSRASIPESLQKTSTDLQQEWLERNLPTLLAKGSVNVIRWNQLSDAAPHEFPNGGLLTTDGTAKPSVTLLKSFREKYLT